MKTLLLLKRADLIVQLLTLLASIIIAVIKYNTDSADPDDIDAPDPAWNILICFYMMGAVQFISMLINGVALDKRLKDPGRRIAAAWAAGIVATAAASLLLYATAFIFFFALLMLAPFLALGYLHITVKEMVHIKTLTRRMALPGKYTTHKLLTA